MSTSMKERLKAYYKDNNAPIDEGEKARVVAMMSKVAGGSSPLNTFDAVPFWCFLVGQLRFVNPLAWLLQIVLLVGTLLVVGAYGGGESSTLIVMTAAVLSVALAVPSVFESFENNVLELEASCRHNSAQVLICRLILFGLADVLWISIASGIIPTLIDSDPFSVFLYAATPFFASCALCFYLSRKARSHCVKACAVSACCVVTVLWAAHTVFPHWYAETSITVWFVALTIAVALAIYEAHRLISQISADSLIRTPYPA